MMVIDRKTKEVSYLKIDYKMMYENSARGFSIRGEQHLNLLKYLSPENETSVYKGIPRYFRFHPAVRALMITGMFKIRYRGTSTDVYKRPQASCHSRYADTFAIYKK